MQDASTAATNGNASGNSASSPFETAAITKQILAQVLSAPAEPGTITDSQLQLYHAQLDLEKLMELQTMFTQLVAAKKQDIESLLLEISPLMSLDDKLLSKLATFQDEEALLELEKTMTALMGEDADITNHDAFTQQWGYLAQTRPFHSNYIDCGTPKHRCLRFTEASQYARKMELHAMYQVS